MINAPSATDKRNRRLSFVMAVIMTLWLPFVLLFVSVGWGTFILLSPLLLFTLTPLLVLTTHLSYKNRPQPKDLFIMESCFYAMWFLVGVFFVNSGDTTESVSSLFTRLLGSDLSNNPGIVSVSQQLSALLFLVAIFFCFFLVVKAGANKKQSNSAA